MGLEPWSILDDCTERKEYKGKQRFNDKPNKVDKRNDGR